MPAYLVVRLADIHYASPYFAGLVNLSMLLDWSSFSIVQSLGQGAICGG